MIDLKIVKVGNTLGMHLPMEVLEHLRLADGDRVVLTELADGGYRLAAYDPDFERQMQAAEDGLRRYRNTLKALAE